MKEHWTNIDSTSFLVSAECCCVGLCLWDRHWTDRPSKHYNAWQSHGASVVSMLHTVSLAQHLVSVAVSLLSQVHFQANTRRWPNVVSMSGCRQRRRANIQTTFTWIIVSCLQGWCSLQVMRLIQICTHRGRYMHAAYVHGDSTLYQLRLTLSGCIAGVLLRSRVTSPNIARCTTSHAWHGIRDGEIRRHLYQCSLDHLR